MAARSRGLIAAARGDLSAAVASIDEALAQLDRTDLPFERGRTLLVLGQLRRRGKQRAQAKGALTAALASLRGDGRAALGGQGEAELARVGRRTAASDELTATERTLAELAAAGLTNREVAERAFVTVKTVEANLTRVYRKLGVRSRTALARALPRDRTNRVFPAFARRPSPSTLPADGHCRVRDRVLLAGRPRQRSAGAGRPRARAFAGQPVRYLGSLLICEDEVVLCLFEGDAEAVRRVAEQAAIPFERILATAQSPWPRADSPSQRRSR